MAKPEFGNQGLAGGADDTQQFSALGFLLSQAVGRLSTCTLVRVISCTNSGGLSPVGFVDVLPLVNQLDGHGNAVPHETLHGLPYLRIQGGTDAVIIDPNPGDIGIAVFASRDISAVKAARGRANPGSWRMHDMADGLYLGGVLNGTPAQYVRFHGGGVEIVSPSAVTVRAPTIEMDAMSAVTISAGASITLSSPVINIDGAMKQGAGGRGGDAEFANDVRSRGVSLPDHTHPDVQSGPNNTGKPNPTP